VEDDESGERQHLGYNFDGFYFLGPSDVRAYFLHSDGGDLTASIQNYFARKFSVDGDFRDYYSIPGVLWGQYRKPQVRPPAEEVLLNQWEKGRNDFFRFYALKAGVNFSLGSHDEWNIWHLLNAGRVKNLSRREAIGELLPGFFDGKQITPGEYTVKAVTGYEITGS
jgi:hypothetical protein